MRIIEDLRFLIALSLCCGILSAQTWEQLSDTPFHSDHSNGFGINGAAYIIQGNSSNELWEYSPGSDGWTYLMDFPGATRSIAIGDDWNGKYYFGFGSDDNGDGLNDLWEFDPVEKSFLQLPSCPCVGRAHPALIAHNNKIMMGSGSTNNGDIDDWWEYDMITMEWTRKEDMPGGPRHHPFFFSHEDKVYVGGGHIQNWLEYDLITEQWLVINGTPGGRVAGTQLNYNGLGLVVAGDDRFHVHVPDNETFMSYNPETDSWRYLPELPMGSKWAPSSFMIDEELYFFGGYNSDVPGDSTMWKFDLRFLDCLPASNLNAVDVTDTSAGLFWNRESSSLPDTLRWRMKGAQSWNAIPNPQAVFALTDLEACTDYEFQVRTACNAMNSDSDLFTFKTDGCCLNPNLEIEEVKTTSANLSWSEILAADEYILRWKAVDNPSWTETAVTEANFDATDLQECTEYEFQIQSQCSNDVISFSPSIKFYTKNCGACTDIEYCSVTDEYEGEEGFIQEVQINDYVNSTGSDGGYGNYAMPDSETLSIGESFSLNVKSQDDFGVFTLAVYIDFNADGNFQDDERVVFEEFVDSDFSTDILIPVDAEEGLTRMRIQFDDAFNAVFPCEMDDGFSFGEVEDYCVTLERTSSLENEVAEDLDLKVYPNPATETLRISSNQLEAIIDHVSIIDLSGTTVFQKENLYLNKDLDISELSSGIYILKVATSEGKRKAIRFVKF